MNRLPAFLAALLLSSGAFAMMKPRVVETKFPTDDVVIASIVIDAPKDGVADATAAIQAAIDEAAAAGGAVVFLPAGKYRLAGRLTIKEGVTLRGDLANDELPKSAILMPTADRGNADGPTAVTMERGSGLTHLAIWYPDQDPMKIVPYPWTIRTSDKVTGDNITIERVTLVNPYQAIKIGPEWNELHTIRDVDGTPLKAGIWMDTCTDIGRVTGVSFGPGLWLGSGLPGAPVDERAGEALRDFLRHEGVAYEMRRSDWENLHGIECRDYAVGLVIRAGQQGSANAVVWSSQLIANTALRLESLNEVGLAVTNTGILGETFGVHAPASFNSTALFFGFY